MLFVPMETGISTVQRSYKIYNFTVTVSLNYLVRLKQDIKQHILKSVI